MLALALRVMRLVEEWGGGEAEVEEADVLAGEALTWLKLPKVSPTNLLNSSAIGLEGVVV